jgi:hypothetical protein
MRRYRIAIYSSDPRNGARPSAELFLLARSQSEAAALAMGRLVSFPWVQLDTTNA